MQRTKFIVFMMSLTIAFSFWLSATLDVVAGGWAVITVDTLPEEAVAGQPVTIGFMVRQHGHTPMAELTPALSFKAEHRPSFTVTAEPEGQVGHYLATVTFPDPGIWQWEINAFTRQQPMPPITVLPAPAGQERHTSWPLMLGIGGLFGTMGSSLAWWRKRTWGRAIFSLTLLGVSGFGFALTTNFTVEAKPPLQAASEQVELGRALFVAKGCITCHQHNQLQGTGNVSLSIGPNLSHFSATPTYLRLWLKDPAALKPETQMPTLNLSDDEIEALIAFLASTENPQSVALAQLPPAPIDTSTIEPFFIRAQGAAGPLEVYDMASQTVQFTLPPGMPSADWSHYFATTRREGATLLQAFDPRTGLTKNSFNFEGAWILSGVSPTGRWVALTRLAGEDEQARWTQEEQWQTEIQIVETASGQVTQSLNLAGNFEVETLSSKGDALFLIQHLPAVNPTQYLVRLYDLSQQRLQPGTLRAKTATDEVMTGLAWGGVASVDGQWLLTLYLNTARNTAFVHALNLESKFPVCIDLPSGEGEFAQLKHYSLALALDSQTVYAANPALGVVAEVSLTEFKVVRASEFTPSALPKQPADIPTNYSVLSPEAAMLYFSSGWDVWGYNPSSSQVVGPYLTGANLRGLGLSKNGRQLYLAHQEAQPQIIDLADEKEISLQ